MIGTLEVRSDAPFEQVRAFLERDVPSHVFVLADLAPPYARFARLATAHDPAGTIVATCLLYEFPGDASLVPSGSEEGIRAILSAIELPAETLLVISGVDRLVLRDYFITIGDFRTIQRMSLVPADFKSATCRPGISVELIEPTTYNEVNSLYGAHGASMDLYPDGTVYGVRDPDGHLSSIAVATAMNGVEGIGTIGGAFTHPLLRGKGLAKAVVSRACDHWFDLGRRNIYLNVARDNLAAISVFSALGFRDRLTYEVVPVRRATTSGPER